jgi:hypothetical protein
MIDGKAHADPVIYISRKIITNIYIVKTADIDAINARDIPPDIMRINPACLAKIMFGNRRIPWIKSKCISAAKNRRSIL